MFQSEILLSKLLYLKIKQNIGHLIIRRSRVYFHKEPHIMSIIIIIIIIEALEWVSSRNQQFLSLSCIEEMFFVILSKLFDL